MNNFSKLFFVVLCLSCSAQVFSQRGNVIPDSITSNFFKEVEYKQRYWDSIGGVYMRKGEHKLFNRWKAFWEMRVDSAGNYPDPKLYFDAFNTATAIAKEKASKSDQFQAIPTWKELGPVENPQGNLTDGGVGRVNIVRANPKNNQELYAGTAFGGAWKSTDGGTSWRPLYQTEFLSLGVSDIAISPTDPKIVYIATGDNDGALGGGGTSYSIGVLKSTDGGATWNTTGSIHTLRENRIIARLWIHPENPDILLAGGSDAIMKTTDGGATWKKVAFPGGRVVDMEQMPNNPNTIYASTMSGGLVYRSDDMGETWKQILQHQGAGRVAIAVTPAAPNNIYVLTALPGSSGSNPPGGGFHSLVTSINRGDTWSYVNVFSNKKQNYLGWSIASNYLNSTGGQGWYDIAIAVSPNSSNTIFIGGINIWKSTDGGANFNPVAYWTQSSTVPYVHADIHDLVFIGNSLYAASDGGIDVTTNLGTSWQQKYKGMGIGQIYYFSSGKQNTNKILIGCQDLGTRIRTGNNFIWSQVGGGDGMGCRFDPTDDNRYYFSIYYGDIRRVQNNSSTQILSPYMLSQQGIIDTAAFISPFDVSPSGKLYVGYCNIYTSTNNGNSWNKPTNYTYSSSNKIVNVKVSTKDEKYVYAHTRSTIYYTSDAGTTWKTRNPAVSSQSISYILPHPENPQMFYVTMSGYSDKNKIFKFDGQNWINLSGNLPNVPANCIAVQIVDGQERIYVGTDIGVFYGLEQAPVYIRWGDNLPNTCVTELEFVVPNLLRAATFGRGVWETTVNNCAVEKIAIGVDGDTAICNRDSIRLYVVTPNQNDVIWSTGETGNEIWVKTAGIYSAVANTNTDCLKPSNFVTIVVKQQNNLNVGTQGTTEMCIGDSVILTASIGFKAGTYKWNTNDTGRTLVVREAGIYFITAENNNSDCISQSDTFIVNTYERPHPATIILIEDATENTNKVDTLEAKTGVKFQWYKDGKQINNQTAKRLIRQRNETNTGLYTVIIANEGDCYSNHSDPFEYVSIKEDIEEAINISPIPAYNVINVELTKEYYGKYLATIIDITGKTIKEFNLNFNGVMTFDIQALPPSTYLLKLESDKHSITKTFVKADK